MRGCRADPNFLADFPDCPIVMTVFCRGSAK
jgi:hypothetical protein